jgi:cytochrome P450
MLYLDPPQHTRVRALAAKGFTPSRVESLREHIRDIVDGLLDDVRPQHGMDVIADFARPLPAIVSCEILGLPAADWPQLSHWTRSFAEVLGNFQHSPLRTAAVKRTVDDMTLYFRDAVRDQEARGAGLLHALGAAHSGGDRLSEDEVVANAIITLVGGLETTTNLIGNGLFTILQRPAQWALLKEDPTLIPSAIEEMLRFESPIQHTARLAPDDTELGGRVIRKRQAITAVVAAANRDPARFPDPDRFDIRRSDNHHLAFGWSTHQCFGAPLARLEAHVAFAAIVERLGSIRLAGESVRWRQNAGAFRGLESLCVEF